MKDFLKKENLPPFLLDDSPRALLIHLSAIILLGILLVLFFFYVYLPVTTHHGETITVPDLTGMHLKEVQEFLEDRDLRFVVADSGYDAKVPALTVMKQDPPKRARVKVNRRIHITIRSEKPPLETVPNIYNNLIKQVTPLLESYGFKQGEIIYKPDIGRNKVLEVQVDGKKIPQSRLEKGYQLPKGTKIDIVVGDGLGHNALEIPDLVGMPLIEAEILLQGLGLNLGSIEYQNDEEKELGTVLEQTPPYTQDEKVKVGSVIDLVVVGYEPEEETEKEGLEYIDN